MLYSYTPDGKLETRTWARGVVTSYTYDEADNLIEISYSDNTPAVSFAYNRRGQQISATVDGVSHSDYEYNALGMLLSENQNGTVIDRRYDMLGRSTGYDLHTDGGRVSQPAAVSYAYDPYGRFAQVGASVPANPNTPQNNLAFNYDYLPGTRLVSGYTSSTGHSLTREYEPYRNLISAVENNFGNSSISRFDYTNDALGRRVSRNNDAFDYNDRNEVITASLGAPASPPAEFAYDYDAIGNRISSSHDAHVTEYIANELNQYTSMELEGESPREPQYDLDGNMTFNGLLDYFYDGENRLIGVYSNNAAIASYAYDHRSRRIAKSTPDAETFFTYDDWNLIHESTTTVIDNSPLTIDNSYIWGLDLSGTLQGAGGVGGLLATINAEGAFAPCYDANGNITDYLTLTSDISQLTSGAIAASYAYSPFGETIASSGELADAFALRFSTKYWEDEPALYYYGYRFCAPDIGRWINRDPIEEIGGMNVYGFVKNTTQNSIDILGLQGTTGNEKNLYAGLQDCPCDLKRVEELLRQYIILATMKSRNHPDSGKKTEHTSSSGVKFERTWYVEYGGYICCGKDGKVSATGPDKGTFVAYIGNRAHYTNEPWLFEGNGRGYHPVASEVPKCPEGTNAVLFYHSHPKDEHSFSGGDIGWSKYNVPIAVLSDNGDTIYIGIHDYGTVEIPKATPTEPK